MIQTEKKAPQEQRQSLLTLCRFLAIRLSYRALLILLAATGVSLSLSQQSQFAPYGIALFCLLLPLYLNDTVKAETKKENSDSPLSVLYRRYHYSPVTFLTYRITLLLCLLLLLIWHIVQPAPPMLFGISLPLLYLASGLALYPLLSRILFFLFHHRLMRGLL